MAGLGDIASIGNSVNQSINRLTQVLENVFPRVSGTFTLSASSATVVSQPSIAANSVVLWSETNASAATLSGSAKALYYSISPGVGFTMRTANGSAAAGTENYSYIIFTPV